MVLKLEFTTFNLTCAQHWLRDVGQEYRHLKYKIRL